jgi:tellurite methyltransferase
MHVAEHFDLLYEQHERYWWRGKDRHALAPTAYPYSLLTQQTLRSIEAQPPGRVLDLGAGEGSDSIRLARLGYQVDAVEISSVAAGKIKCFADEAGVQVNVIIEDICEFAPTRSYDVIICNGVLHYVEDKETAVRNMQASTNDGGINVISLWSSHTPVPEFHRSIPVYCDDEDGIVTKLYQGWRIELLYFERNKIETAHPGAPEHRHSHIKLIARKPADDAVLPADRQLPTG